MNQVSPSQSNSQKFPLLIPACAGEIILTLVSNLTVLFKSNHLSNKLISDNLSNLCKSLTSSSFCSIYFCDNSFLKSESLSPIPITTNSFHGLVACNKQPQIINQAFQSTLLKSFEDSYWPSHLSLSLIQNLCAVPILDENGQIFIVVFIYNKQDSKKSCLNFTLNDVYLIQSACKLAQEITNIQLKLKSTQEDLNRSTKIFKETNYLYSTTAMLLRREKCFDYLLKNTETINQTTLELMSIALNASAAILHVKINHEFTAVLTYGLDGKKIKSTQTCEHTVNSIKDIWISHDLKGEPLWNSRLLDYRSLMSCPVFNQTGSIMAVVEFLRQETSFSDHDKSTGKELSSILGKIEYKTYISVQNSNDSKLPMALSKQMLVDSEILIERVRNSVSVLVPNENCTFFMVNQVQQENWTISSGYVQSAEIQKDSLLTYLTETKKSAILPPNCKLPIRELSNYKNKYLMVVPVINNWFDSPVIGTLILCKSTNFSNTDLDSIEKTANVLAFIMEALFVVSNPVSNTRVFNLVAETPSVTNTQYERPLKPSQSLHYLFQIDSLSQENFLKLSKMRKILENSENPLISFASSISSTMQCKAGGLLIKNLTEDYFVYLPKGTLINLGGIIQQCFIKNQTICIKKSPEDVPEFDPRIDNLELGELISNILCVPVPSFKDEVLAVICLLNSSSGFNIEDIVVVQYFALVLREIINIKQPELSSSQLILNETRKNKILLRWFKQVFVVSNSLKHKHELSKEVYQKVLSNVSLDTLVTCLLQIIKAITNTEEVFALLYNSENLTKYSSNHEVRPEELTGEVLEYIQTNSVLTLSKHKNKENQLIYPFNKLPSKLVTVLINKKDETLSYYCLFNRADEALISEISSIVHSALTNQTTFQVKAAIKRFAAGMNTTSLINTIRSGAQHLLECDRATVFLRENDFLVVKAQGIEHEIPVGIKVPINKGIVGFVAQTGQSENIEDVYKDTRFNQEIDLMTGFRTRSMLCMPVFDANSQVIAALQMINKRSGVFNKNDEENLELFAQMASSVLQNWMMMEKIIEERGVYLNILNSIGNYVMVVNCEGKLQYFNKQIKDVFGVSEVNARTGHYSAWLKFNRQLVIDITSVFQNPDSKIARSGQRILTQDVPRIVKDIKFVENSKAFNYTVSSLHDSFSTTSSGIIVILEDASAFQELNVKFHAIQNQLIQLTNPVQTETSLQRCVNRLRAIQETFENGTSVFAQIQEIIDTLRKGNLNKTEVLIPIELKSMEKELKSRLTLYVEDNQVYTRRASKIDNIGKRMSIEMNLDYFEISELQKWSLDAYQVTNHFKYIRLMFDTFDLISDFDINNEAMASFLVKVKSNYLENPFHNFYHGFTVMHSAFYLLNLKKINEIFNKQEMLAVLVASLCHDLGHRGFTNLYEINSFSDLSILYNDISVLENHHTALTFKLISDSDSNIFSNISKEATKYIRKIIIESILSTDMMKHFPIIGSHTDRFKQIDKFPIGSLEKDCEHLSGFIVHCCDIGHPTKSLELYSKFSKLVCEEFSQQYSMEIKNGLPATEFMKGLNEPLNYYVNEVGFLSVIVKPLWECFYLWAEEEIEVCMKNLNENLAFYQVKKEKLMKEVQV